MKFTVRHIDLKKRKKKLVKILIAQPNWTKMDWDIIDGLFFHKAESSANSFVEKILEKAKDFAVNFVIFPELSIPEKLISIICAWANQNDCIVLAGSHYKNTEKGYISKAPVIFENNIYYSEKIVPAPSEVSPFPDEGLKGGETVLVFKNSYLGNFSLLICADYLAEIKEKLFENKLDFLFVPAFQKRSETYHNRMNIDCENSADGIYLVYANNCMEGVGDGKSAFFCLMDSTFREKFKGRTTDGNPITKIIELDCKTDYIILEVNTGEKKPTLGKTVHSRPNVKIVSQIQVKKENKVDSTPYTNVDLEQLKRELRISIIKLISKHGLDDANWLQAPSSQLFLSYISHELELTESEEYKNLVNAFFQFFTPKYDDSLSLIEERVLITPDENSRIIQSMKDEDELDPFFKSSSKTIAENINPRLQHENYLYAVALGISSLVPSNFMNAVTNSALNYLIYKKNPSSLDNHGGWYPYRVSWITARILISLSHVDLSNRPDIKNIQNTIDLGLESLIKRLDNEGYWRSGVGNWVSKWESTALCLEAFLSADTNNKYRVVIETLIERLANNREWLLENPDFSSEEATNETLANILMMAVLIQSKKKYELSSILDIKTEILYVDFCIKTINKLLEKEDIEIRQFCTIPQIVSYCLFLIKDKS